MPDLSDAQCRYCSRWKSRGHRAISGFCSELTDREEIKTLAPGAAQIAHITQPWFACALFMDSRPKPATVSEYLKFIMKELFR